MQFPNSCLKSRFDVPNILRISGAKIETVEKTSKHKHALSSDLINKRGLCLRNCITITTPLTLKNLLSLPCYKVENTLPHSMLILVSLLFLCGEYRNLYSMPIFPKQVAYFHLKKFYLYLLPLYGLRYFILTQPLVGLSSKNCTWTRVDFPFPLTIVFSVGWLYMRHGHQG